MTPEQNRLDSLPSEASLFEEVAFPTTSVTLQTSIIDHIDKDPLHLCEPENLNSALESETDDLQLSLPKPYNEYPLPRTPPEIYLSPCESPTRLDLDSSFAAGLDDPRERSTTTDSLGPQKGAGRVSPSSTFAFNLDATLHSPLFPPGHRLNPHFVRHYRLEDELGAGGYGFVMTARHRTEFHEVAVKFIIKSKVPNHAWVEDEMIGRLPMEVMLLSFIEHENIVKCLDLFEDHLYFYLIQELHGSPWPKTKRHHHQSLLSSTSSACLTPSTPALSPSVSTSSFSSSSGGSITISQHLLEDDTLGTRSNTHNASPISPNFDFMNTRPEFSRRSSHDLFECIEQSEHKRLSEIQARYVFSQVVDAVYYLNSQGITHRDIKDENLVIDKDLRVKLIDFGSAAVVDPGEPRPYYSTFYGTTGYASPEILLKKRYQAPPAEIWTLGVLLSYLLTGISPFPTVKDATHGRITFPDTVYGLISSAAMDLMQRCLDPNPITRATITEVKTHAWLA